MKLLRIFLLATALVAPCVLRADEPAPFVPYEVIVAGKTYQVESADAANGYRVATPDGRVIGVPTATPAAVLSAESLAAALATPPAPAAGPGKWTALTFFERFTEAEQLAILESPNEAVRLFRAKLLAAQEVRSDDARTVAGLDLLVSQGLITSARKTAILTP